MTAGRARRIALDWVRENADSFPGFSGAYLIGSINFREQDDPLPPTSDIDVRIVVDMDDRKQIAERGLRQQIRSVQGVTLDMGCDPLPLFSTPEQVSAYRVTDITETFRISSKSAHYKTVEKKVK